MDYQGLLGQFEGGLVSLTEFVLGMNALGYEISGMKSIEGKIELHCFDKDDKFFKLKTNYRV